jgi:elongation factor Ts
VARTPEFRELAHDLAMQVAATSPSYVSIDEVPTGAWADLEKEHGDRDRAAAAVVLMEQPFIKDPKQTIRDLVREKIGKLGENIVVRRFARFEVGTGNSAAEE